MGTVAYKMKDMRLSVYVLLLALSCWAGERVKVAVVFDATGKSDRGLDSLAYEGGTRARKGLGVVFKYAKAKDDVQMEEALRGFASKGFDLVIGTGFAAQTPLKRVAEEFPKTRFAIVDAVLDLPNVASITFREHEGGFLVGIIAGMKTQSNVLGFIGGVDIPPLRRLSSGFERGAKYANPKVQLLVDYIGTGGDSWNNPAKAKELALAQIAKKADIIFEATGKSGTGVFEAVAEQKKLAIGTDTNKNRCKPGFVLTSMLKRIDLAVYRAIEDVADGRFKAGVRSLGLSDCGLGYALDEYNKDLIPQNVLDAVNKAMGDIISGKLVVQDPTAQQ